MATTPGPWILCHDGDFDERTRQEYRWPWQIVGADDTVVVDFTGGSDDISDEDAELIRSAPELKAAVDAVRADLTAEIERLREKLLTALGGYTCPHTTDPIQARRLCKACRAEDARQVESPS